MTAGLGPGAFLLLGYHRGELFPQLCALPVIDGAAVQGRLKLPSAVAQLVGREHAQGLIGCHCFRLGSVSVITDSKPGGDLQWVDVG
jgi:hypothetical protein